MDSFSFHTNTIELYPGTGPFLDQLGNDELQGKGSTLLRHAYGVAARHFLTAKHH